MATSIFDYASFVWDGRLAGGAPGKLFPLKPNVKDLTGDFLTVSRTTAKWVLGSNGVLTEVAANTPAIEYNADGSYKGLLVEPAATNLMLYSDAQVTTALNTSGSVTSVLSSVPAYTQGVTQIFYRTYTRTGTTDDFFGKSATIGISDTITGSFIVEKTTGDPNWASIAIAITGGTTVFIRRQFNTNTGLFGTSSAGTWSIQDLGTAWRITATVTNNGSVGNVNAQLRFYPVYNLDGGVARNDTITGSKNLFAWQLETGSVATSYIPTVASTANRTADSVTLTGASSLIGQQEGTVYAEGFITNFAGATDSIFTISDGTVNNRIEVNKRSPNTIALERVSAIQSGATTISSGALSTGLVKIAIAYKTGDTAIFINGVQAGATSTATFTTPTIGNLVLGANATAGTRFWNSNIRSFAVFPTRLANATLATLTT